MVTDSGLRFGPDVPVKTIEVVDPAIEAIPQNEREVIGKKVSYRLAQQPGSYVVLKYIRRVVKRIDTETILTPPAPANVLERSVGDVSFLAGMLVDKFAYHLPLYRQHQRLRDSGIELSRSTLIGWTSRAIDLLAPITAAQSAHVLNSRVLAMDETSIKAGREAKGKMRTGWLWPVYGDSDEVVFHYAPSRARRHVHAVMCTPFSASSAARCSPTATRRMRPTRGNAPGRCSTRNAGLIPGAASSGRTTATPRRRPRRWR